MSIRGLTKLIVNKAVEPFGLIVVKKVKLVDYCLYEYESYEDYKNTQIKFNNEKIKNIWADEKTLDRVAKIIQANSGKKSSGLCHGTRNGFEQNYLIDKYNMAVIGTDISPTAANYDNSIIWDFHDENPEWVGKHDFVYTNSLDQSWNPKKALQVWMNQIKKNGILIIEHTEAHSPTGAGLMDPFGVKPKVMPYVLSDWFGHSISISHSVDTKDNFNIDAWLFVIKKIV